MRVTVIGTGYVGSVTGACLAYLGHQVTCVDTDESKIAKWRRGEPPIYEPCLAELVRAAGKRVEFSTELDPAVRASDVIFIAVGTPPCPDGSPDLTYLEAASRSIGAAMDESRFRVVVNKSTVPVGSGNLVETLVREGIEESNPGSRNQVQFGVASNPEFLREGSAVADSLYPDRIVLGGSDDRTLGVMLKLYHPLVEQSFASPAGVSRPASLVRVPVVITSLSSAEMIRYAANAFLTVKIGFANEFASMSGVVCADGAGYVEGTGVDSRIGAE